MSINKGEMVFKYDNVAKIDITGVLIQYDDNTTKEINERDVGYILKY